MLKQLMSIFLYKYYIILDLKLKNDKVNIEIN